MKILFIVDLEQWAGVTGHALSGKIGGIFHSYQGFSVTPCKTLCEEYIKRSKLEESLWL